MLFKNALVLIKCIDVIKLIDINSINFSVQVSFHIQIVKQQIHCFSLFTNQIQ